MKLWCGETLQGLCGERPKWTQGSRATFGSRGGRPSLEGMGGGLGGEHKGAEPEGWAPKGTRQGHGPRGAFGFASCNVPLG